MKKLTACCITIFLLLILLTACTPKVGSPEWCKKIKGKESGDITVNEAKDYAKHCIFK